MAFWNRVLARLTQPEDPEAKRRRRDKELQKQLSRWTTCFKCGAMATDTRVVTSGSFAKNRSGAGVVSGRLWHCHKCNHACCIPCSAGSASGIRCPKCGGEYSQGVSSEARERMQAILAEARQLGLHR